jgi:hypothetical protein
MVRYDPHVVAIGTDTEVDTSGYGTCPVVRGPDCPNCKCIEHQHSDHKLVVWDFEAKLRPARVKRPDQLRWKMDDLLENKERQAACAKCATDRGELARIVAGAGAPGYTTNDMESAIVAELKAIAADQLGKQVVVPGDGRVKAHTWRVTKAIRAKSTAESALKRCRRGSTLQELKKCKSAYKDASKTFTKVRDAEVRKIFRLKMEKEAAKDNPQLSKRDHQAFKYVTGSVSKGDGLGDIATWTTPGGTKVARGHQAVGAVVSEYTHIASARQGLLKGSSVRSSGPQPSRQSLG